MNKYVVPKRQWKRWSPLAQSVFNTVFSTMLDQQLFQHPMAATLHRDHWDTTAWNAAWVAASAVDA
jgi:hypothetical protein